MKFVEITLHRRCTSVRFSSNPPARPPAMVGPGYSVGRSIDSIKFPTIFRCTDSFLGRRAF